jgi:hypothetical protein
VLILDEHEREKSKLDLPEFDVRLIPVGDDNKPIPSIETMALIKKDVWDKMSEDEQIATIKADKEHKRKKLEESFWVNLSVRGIVFLCILAGLAGAGVGYFGTWLVIWFGGLAVYKLIKWIVLGFYDSKGKDVRGKG